jgi:hypothetical protein
MKQPIKLIGAIAVIITLQIMAAHAGNLTVSGILTVTNGFLKVSGNSPTNYGDVWADRLIIGVSPTVTGSYASTLGGTYNYAVGSMATVCGGSWNSASGRSAFVGAGGDDGSSMDSGNTASGAASAVVGGYGNIATNTYAFVGGGRGNTAGSTASTIAGGYGNRVDGTNSNGAVLPREATGAAIGGGYNNIVYGAYGVIPGGQNNSVGYVVSSGEFPYRYGLCSFAAGQNAQANGDHCFVWSDGSATTSGGGNQFVARASGGFVFYTGTGSSLGVKLTNNATAWATLSDRNAKENIEPINVRDILGALISMPISKWSYKADPGHRRYIGPMAQDFHAAFSLGDDDTHISTLDSESVALAAIQGLNQKVEEKDAEIQALKQSVAELKAMVEKLAGK